MLNSIVAAKPPSSICRRRFAKERKIRPRTRDLQTFAVEFLPEMKYVTAVKVKNKLRCTKFSVILR